MKLGEHYEVDFAYDVEAFGIVPGTDLWYVGRTICKLSNDNGCTFGIAFCSAKENFSKKEGRKQSFTKALRDMFPGKMNKAVRSDLWSEYWRKIHR